MTLFVMIIGIALGLLMGEPAHAQGFIRGVIHAVSMPSAVNVGTGSPGEGLRIMVAYILGAFRPLLYVAGLIAITVVGMRMVIGQEDDALDKGKTVVGAVVSAIVLSFLIEPMVNIFVTMQSGGLNAGAAANVTDEVSGILDWGLALAGVLAVTFIIISALKAVANPTNEEGIANLRQTVISVVFGIVILAARGAIAVAVGGKLVPNAIGLIAIPVQIATAILGLLGLAAVAVIIYAGVLMILNYANEEQIQKGKSLLIRAVTGLALVIICFALVRFVVALAH